MSDNLIKGHDAEGPIRYMTLDEIKERADLNIANTASAQRARVLAELSKGNGNNNGHKNGFSARI